jgi:acetoin utilization deacetylase AcuC-like enzyme
MLRTWFRWCGNNTIQKKSTAVSFLMLKIHMLQDTQVYSKMFYESKLKRIIEEELRGQSPLRNEQFAKIMKVTKQEWAKESDEVKAMVKEKKEEMQQEQEHLESKDAGAKQSAIDDLSRVVGAFFQASQAVHQLDRVYCHWWA